jgi:hypothetical protein
MPSSTTPQGTNLQRTTPSSPSTQGKVNTGGSNTYNNPSTTSSGTNTSVDQSSSTTTSTTTSSDADQSAQNRSLPATGGELPLIGLFGVLATTAGYLVRFR